MSVHEIRPPVYGPCFSRLYGDVMAVNFFPCGKVCSFDCVYCQCGPTKRKAASAEELSKDAETLAYTPSDIEAALLATDLGKVRTLVVSGNGEPLLCPGLTQSLSVIQHVRNTRYRHLKLVLLSNGSCLRQELLATLESFDELVFKLDAGDEKTLAAVNKPLPDLKLATLVQRLRMFSRFKLRTAVLAENLESLRSMSYAEIVNELRPAELTLYPVDRPIPGQPGMSVPDSCLHSLADELRESIAVPIRVISHSRPRGTHPMACPSAGTPCGLEGNAPTR